MNEKAQYITIKKVQKDGITIFVVNAIPLKNKNHSVIQKIPHPLGTDALEFKTIEEAQEAVVRAGFAYLSKDGTVTEKKTTKPLKKYSGNSYEEMIFDTLKDKVNSSNSNVSASAVLALSEFQNEEVFDILFKKLGEENDLVRKNAITGICKYGNYLQDRIIESLSDTNWVTRLSAVSCISNLIDNETIDIERFIKPLISISNDTNPIIQTAAINTLGLVYTRYKSIQ